MFLIDKGLFGNLYLCQQKNGGKNMNKNNNNRSLELLIKSELEESMSYVQKALDILNFDKLKLTELSNKGEDLILNLELIKIELFNLICKR